MKPSLFQRVVAASGLSPIFAEEALRRALHRVDLDENQLSRAQLQRALPELLRVIGNYLPEQTSVICARLERLED